MYWQGAGLVHHKELLSNIKQGWKRCCNARNLPSIWEPASLQPPWRHSARLQKSRELSINRFNRYRNIIFIVNINVYVYCMYIYYMYEKYCNTFSWGFWMFLIVSARGLYGTPVKDRIFPTSHGTMNLDSRSSSKIQPKKKRVACWLWEDGIEVDKLNKCVDFRSCESLLFWVSLSKISPSILERLSYCWCFSSKKKSPQIFTHRSFSFASARFPQNKTTRPKNNKLPIS